MRTKTCNVCRETLDWVKFSRRKDSPDGLQGTCRTCASRRNREWAKHPDNIEARNNRQRTYYDRNKERIRLRENCKRYGLSEAEYVAMWDRQEGRCAICKRSASTFKRAMDVDHNHKTGKVRALLCKFCNSAIGYFQEDVARLRAAAEYLEQHNQ